MTIRFSNMGVNLRSNFHEGRGRRLELVQKGMEEEKLVIEVIWGYSFDIVCNEGEQRKRMVG